MLLRAARLSRTTICGIATLLIATSTSGCGRPHAKGVGFQANAPKSHKAGTDIGDDCDEIPGDNDFPPSTKQPTDGARFSAYSAGECFAYDNAKPNEGHGNWADVRKTPATTGVQLEIMPEVRMRHTDPTTDAEPGQGMVVALVRNLDAKTPYEEQNNKNWQLKRQLAPGQDALIWLSRDQSTAVLFTYKVTAPSDTLVTVLSTTTSATTGNGDPAWIRMRVDPGSKNPPHALARWVHPPEPPSASGQDAIHQQGRVQDEAGTGWVTCLAGCCTPNGLLIVE